MLLIFSFCYGRVDQWSVQLPCIIFCQRHSITRLDANQVKFEPRKVHCACTALIFILPSKGEIPVWLHVTSLLSLFVCCQGCIILSFSSFKPKAYHFSSVSVPQEGANLADRLIQVMFFVFFESVQVTYLWNMQTLYPLKITSRNYSDGYM